MQAPLHNLEQHPDLSELINDLNTRFLAPTGLSLEYDRELHQARYNLKHKKGYLETKTLFEPVDQLRFLPLDNHRQGGADTALSNQAAGLQRRIAAHIDRIISILEVRRLVITTDTNKDHHDSGADKKNQGNGPYPFRGKSQDYGDATTTTKTTSLMEVLANWGDKSMEDNIQDQDLIQEQDEELGLDIFTLEQLRPHVDALDEFSQPMTEAIQQSIQQKVQDVIALYNSGASGNNASIPATNDQRPPQPALPARSMSDVISVVKKQLLFLDGIKEVAVVQEIAIQHRSKELFETLQQSIVVLWEILTEFMIRYQLEQDLTFKEYFSQMVDSVVLKLEILRVSMQESVYDKDIVAQLTQVRDALDQKKQALELQINHNAALLHQYQSAGNEFNIIVDAYSDIMRRIEVVQDDIRRLE
ncbi:HAUS augmin-like complex subunit 4-domain-containing protein [Dissophora ornata]|nr:HAUS augmin-like complex subunit 4-domain-containing protein [Dissophora ornata]